MLLFFFFNYPTTTEIYTLSLHDALPILYRKDLKKLFVVEGDASAVRVYDSETYKPLGEIKVSIDADSIAYDPATRYLYVDRKSTRLNSSHQIISYAVFCLKKKNNTPVFS